MNIIITGTNRGLGHELVKILTKQHPEIRLFVTSRQSPEAFSKQWEQAIGPHKLQCYQLDLKNSQNIGELVANLKQQGIIFDRVVANAAVGADYGTTMPSAEIAKQTMDTNVISTIDFIKQFLPILSPEGRVVVVSSLMGQLTVHSQTVRNRLLDPKITQEDLLKITQDYKECAKKQNMGQYHWSAYSTSKAIINTWTRFVLPRYLKPGQQGIAMHPGWCRTDMGGQAAPLSSVDGARLIYNSMWVKQIVPDKFFNNKFVDYFSCM